MFTTIIKQSQIDIQAAIVSNSLYGTQSSFQYYYIFRNIASGLDLSDSFLNETETYFTFCTFCNRISTSNKPMQTTNLIFKTTTPPPSICNPNPCRNGGLCSKNVKKNRYLCFCPVGFTGNIEIIIVYQSEKI
jgi:hypothetical protein